MKAIKLLPSNYIFAWEIDLPKNVKLAVLLNIACVGLFLFFGWLFLEWSVFLRRMIPITTESPGTHLSNLGILWELLAAYVLALILHEAVHGLFFILVTRERPVFGIRGVFAYAAAPGWYIPRNPYLLVGLAPLLLISLVGLAVVIVVPNSILFPLLIALTTNASGAVGDLYFVARLLGMPAESLINDRGDGIAVYYPV